MIQLSNVTIPQTVLDKLKEYQDEIDALQTFAEKSAKAQSSFRLKNRRGNRTFDAVKVGLIEMCSGARRCAYCEDSVGDEVEHIRPKSFFPANCFDWDNYVYACGNCNSPKNNKFALFRDNGDFYEVNLNVEIEPPNGKDAMINPRIENPLDYCVLDLSGTFKFVVNPQLKDAQSKQKAEYTFLKVLNLNEAPREFLRQAREEAFEDYKARLEKYRNEKNGNNNQTKLDKMIEGIKRKQHPTVWKEMQRHYRENWLQQIDEELHSLFEESPEALNW